MDSDDGAGVFDSLFGVLHLEESSLWGKRTAFVIKLNNKKAKGQHDFECVLTPVPLICILTKF